MRRPHCRISLFLPRLDPRRDHGRDRRRQHARLGIAHEVNVVLADENGLRLRHETLALGRAQPGDGRTARGEALQDDPVDLGGRRGRHHRLLDEPWLRGNRLADALLPFGEFLVHAGFDPRLGDDGHRLSVLRGHEPSLSKMRSGESGRLVKRTPVASATALTIAGATQLMPHSPCALAPSGPILS